MGTRAALAGLVLGAAFSVAALAQPAALQTAAVTQQAAGGSASYDGVVEAVRHTTMAAQVAGAVVDLRVQAGDRVKKGQVLLRIDARAAAEGAAASSAQVEAARSQLDVATREYERQKQLAAKQYISRAQLERAEAQYRATAAQLRAQIANASATRIQAGFFVLTAPYSGIVSDVPVTLGDMAAPGRPLLVMYDPAALRVTASLPQSALAQLQAGQPARVELPGLPEAQRWIVQKQVQVLPTFDASTHSAQLRVPLPAGVPGLTPGMFARVWVPTTGAVADAGRLYVPSSALVRRAELNGVYVISRTGKPILRQVRVGRSEGGRVEILSGVAAGERVALNPQAAARTR